MNDAITPEEIQAGFLQVVVSKATAADSDEATNLSSAVASDTTLGLRDNFGPTARQQSVQHTAAALIGKHGCG